MLYSLPSRDLIADSVEFMVEAHCADALICTISRDTITPGMLMAALGLNIPTVFVSRGPMEGGTAVLVDGMVRTRLTPVSAIADAVATEVSDDDIARIEEAASRRARCRRRSARTQRPRCRPTRAAVRDVSRRQRPQEEVR